MRSEYWLLLLGGWFDGGWTMRDELDELCEVNPPPEDCGRASEMSRSELVRGGGAERFGATSSMISHAPPSPDPPPEVELPEGCRVGVDGFEENWPGGVPPPSTRVVGGAGGGRLGW